MSPSGRKRTFLVSDTLVGDEVGGVSNPVMAIQNPKLTDELEHKLL